MTGTLAAIEVNKQFKVGDHVRIRCYGDMKKNFGSRYDKAIGENVLLTYYHFLKPMKQLCRKSAAISGFSSTNEKGVYLKFDDCPSFDTRWNYSTDMLEHLKGVTT
ncbi:MAG: hypothetical protein PHE09_18935 [Oscillospiraceae bacterium]|nr:hypothetical protein [Oscillospiraceae bacterium]